MKRVLITGVRGLIGSACARRFYAAGWEVHGIDNDSRASFFGAQGSSSRGEGPRALEERLGVRLHNHDICDERHLRSSVQNARPDAIIHTAAQPSHDRAADIALRDFDVNARATLQLLELARKHCPEAPFVFLSTNKVYGDSPNDMEVREGPLRMEWTDPRLHEFGWDESYSIDGSMHSLFGCSKAAADLYVQEYGRYFGMPTVCLRGGCLTGGSHAGAPLHGFLSYLARAIVQGIPYTVHGYGGKQVRDNLHADDVAAFCELFVATPRSAAVYNIGGGKANSCSVLEAGAVIAALAGKPWQHTIEEEARKGDHVVYYSDLRRIQRDYPQWSVQRSLGTIFEELVAAWRQHA